MAQKHLCIISQNREEKVVQRGNLRIYNLIKLGIHLDCCADF